MTTPATANKRRACFPHSRSLIRKRFATKLRASLLDWAGDLAAGRPQGIDFPARATGFPRGGSNYLGGIRLLQETDSVFPGFETQAANDSIAGEESRQAAGSPLLSAYNEATLLPVTLTNAQQVRLSRDGRLANPDVLSASGASSEQASNTTNRKEQTDSPLTKAIVYHLTSLLGARNPSRGRGRLISGAHCRISGGQRP